MASGFIEEMMAPSPPQDERLLAVDHLIVTEREMEQANRRADETAKAAAVAREAYYAAQERVRSVLGYDTESVTAKSPGY